jgi:hypothetical protein
MAAPVEKLAIHTPTAVVRWRGSWNSSRISDSVDGASVAPAAPRRAGGDEHLDARREGGGDRGRRERRRPDQQQPAAADAVSEGSHGDEQAGGDEAVDVDDPQQLGGGRPQVGADRRHCEVQDGEVHRVDDAGQRQHGEREPLSASGAAGRSGGHRNALLVVAGPLLERARRSAEDGLYGRVNG